MHVLVVASLVAIFFSTTVRALSTNILIPLYVYPTHGAWDAVYSAIRKHPSLQFQIIINPSSGPGSSSSVGYDSSWIKATSTLNSFHNAQTFGYVHLLHGAAMAQDVEANITAWASWHSYRQADISVRGVFFDETPAADAPYMQALTDYARAQLGPETKLIFNPGTVADSRYFAMADHVIVSEVAAGAYSPSIPRHNVAPEVAAKASILVYDFAAGGGTRKQLKHWLRGMADAGIGSVNVVDYGWNNSASSDGPADVGSVARLLASAAGRRCH